MAIEFPDKFIDRLFSMEGCSATPYRCPAGLLTIGCGHVLTKSELSSGKLFIGDECCRYQRGLSEDQIRGLLQRDLEIAFKAMLEPLTVSSIALLTENQRLALVSFIFNVGVDAYRHSTLVKELNQGNFDAVPTQLKRWVHAKGRKLKGLVSRRQWEADLWAGKVAIVG